MTSMVSDPPRVQIVVVSFETRDCLLACLDSIAGLVRLPIEVTVVDNASTDGSADAVRRRHPTAHVIPNRENLGFSTACNQGWRAGRAPFVLFLNPDAELHAGTVETLSTLLEGRSDLGVVGPRTRHPDGSVQVSTGPDLTPRSEWLQRRLVRGVARRDPSWLARAAARHATEGEVDWVSGACLMARRQALQAVGGFDEGFFLYEEDADLCRRVRAAGWRVLFTPAVEVRHHLGRSMEKAAGRARLEYHRSHLRYYDKHNGALARLLLRLSLLARSLALLLGRGPADAGRERARSLLRLLRNRG